MIKKTVLIVFGILFLSFISAGYADYDEVGVGVGDEVCDGVDNDGDGFVDEDLIQVCSMQNPNMLLGNCVGIKECTWGIWFPEGPACNILALIPIAETCNGLDDNCNGVADEGFNVGNSCGMCGSIQCNSGGTQGVCVGEGVCYNGTKETRQCGSSGVGECRYGLEEKTCFGNCSWSGFGSCVGAVHATLEVCDGLDNDCDGNLSDDGEAETWLGAECDGSDTDFCKEGVLECISGGQVCSDNSGNTLEVCDGIDNDCDNEIDEGCPCTPFGDTEECGIDVGVCRKGVRSCTSAGWGSCVGSVVSVPEVCDGLDNDCDGPVDNNLLDFPDASLTEGVCENSKKQCLNGVWEDPSYSSSYELQETLCDGLDNDCDGEIDENLTRQCGSSSVGVCSFGIQSCVNAVWSNCSGNVEPSTEICDVGLLDEDCDGFSNIGCACSGNEVRECGIDIGACEKGHMSCSGGVWGMCLNDTRATNETCDGLDNDCDGQSDEVCFDFDVQSLGSYGATFEDLQNQASVAASGGSGVSPVNSTVNTSSSSGDGETGGDASDASNRSSASSENSSTPGFSGNSLFNFFKGGGLDTKQVALIVGMIIAIILIVVFFNFRNKIQKAQLGDSQDNMA